MAIFGLIMGVAHIGPTTLWIVVVKVAVPLGIFAERWRCRPDSRGALVEPPKEHGCVPGRLIVIAAGQYDAHTPQLADFLAERHKIIGNNWQNASTAQLIARYLRRAVAVMERIDFSPTGLRKILASERTAPSYLYAAAEIINHAADLSAASSVLTNENERRWRIFHERVEQIIPSGC